MSDYEVHMDDEGTFIKVDLTEGGVSITADDLANATEIKIKFERKDRTTFEATGNLWVDGDGKTWITCFSTDAFFSVKGDMSIQVFIKYANGEWHSAKETFTVNENILVEA